MPTTAKSKTRASAAALIIFAVAALHASDPRPKILGIAYVKFKTTDLEKAKGFYGGELGLTNGNTGDAKQDTFIVNQDQRVELVKTAPGTGGSYLIEIGLATDNLAKMREYLTAKEASPPIAS